MIYLLDHEFNIIEKLDSIYDYNEKYNDFVSGDNLTMMGRCFLEPTINNEEGLGYIFDYDNVITKEYTSEEWEYIKRMVKIYERENNINHILN